MTQAAEMVVLESIAAEGAAENLSAQAGLAMGRAIFDEGNRKKLLEHAMGHAESANNMRMLDWKKKKTRSSLETLLDVYSLLEKQKVV